MGRRGELRRHFSIRQHKYFNQSVISNHASWALKLSLNFLWSSSAVNNSFITIFNFIVKVIINRLNYFLKWLFSHFISIINAVRIVFQIRKRCTLPTCAVGHRARDFWRRFLAGRLSSACSVYVVWTALWKFSLRIE